jgi:hypothetical protein
MKFNELSQDELEILKTRDLTVLQIAEKLNIGQATVCRWRKKLDIVVPRGIMLGTIKTEKVLWQCYGCKKEEYRNPSRSKSKYCRSCFSKSDEWREFLRGVDKSYMKTEKYRQSRLKSDTPEYTRYKNEVHKRSHKIYEENIDIINPNRYNRTLAGIEDGWQLDHIIPVRFGFDNNIPIEVLCAVENLRMIPWKDNLARNRKEEKD